MISLTAHAKCRGNVFLCRVLVLERQICLISKGFGFAQGKQRLDIQTLCLQNQSPAGRDVLIRKLPPIPLISIADVKYYNQDFKPGSSFLRDTFLSLFQPKIVLILFCWKQQWVPYVGFLVPGPAAFQGFCRKGVMRKELLGLQWIATWQSTFTLLWIAGNPCGLPTTRPAPSERLLLYRSFIIKVKSVRSCKV